MSDETKPAATEPTKPTDEITALKAQLEALNAKISKFEVGKPTKEETEQDLRTKAQSMRQTSAEEAEELKDMENAISFALNAPNYVDEHKDLLPTTIPDILKAAEKEKYDSKVHKAKALKAAFIGEFFSVASNQEVLTKNQKLQLDDYLKLTKTGREEKATQIYENIFEPALETMKKLKKAEEIAKAKNPAHSQTNDDPFLQRLTEQSRKRYNVTP